MTYHRLIGSKGARTTFNKIPVANRTPNVATKRCNRYRPTDRREDFIGVNVQLFSSQPKCGPNTRATLLLSGHSTSLRRLFAPPRRGFERNRDLSSTDILECSELVSSH